MAVAESSFVLVSFRMASILALIEVRSEELVVLEAVVVVVGEVALVVLQARFLRALE